MPEEIMNTVVEETVGSAVGAVAKSPSGKEIAAVCIVIGAAGYGVGKGVEWLGKKIFGKFKKTDPEVIEAVEVVKKAEETLE